MSEFVNPLAGGRPQADPRAGLLLVDVGNTHTHLGWARGGRVRQQGQFLTAEWFRGGAESAVAAFMGRGRLLGAVLASVVPRATSHVERLVSRRWAVEVRVLTAASATGLAFAYPRPETIGADRLANALAAREHFGAPVVAVDFGTAVTFDVVDRAGRFAGGIIAPGLAAMTGYLAEHTALLPDIKLYETPAAIGKSTEQAIRIGVLHGFRAMVRGLLGELRQELRCRQIPVVATGGDARRVARGVPEIAAVAPDLTLEGLRLFAEIGAPMIGCAKTGRAGEGQDGSEALTPRVPRR